VIGGGVTGCKALMILQTGGALTRTVKKSCPARTLDNFFCGYAGVSKGGGMPPLAHDLAFKV